MLEGPGLGTWDVDHTIDNGVGHMDTLGSEFAGKRLCQSAQCKFARGKCCEIGRSLQTGSGAGEDQSGRMRD